LIVGVSSMCTDASARSAIASSAVMRTNESLVSPDRHYSFIVQGDGNAVVYDNTCFGKPNCGGWNTGTNGRSSDPYFRIQPDGNLLVYNGEPANKELLYNIYDVYDIQSTNDTPDSARSH
jgi:hypothetical protein